MLPIAAASGSTRGSAQAGPRVVVIGAGAFGGWTALELRRRGARVTLIDAWGPGNARASSGGETRFFRSTGALWMFGRDDSFGRASAAAVRAAGMPIEELTPADAAKRFPQIAF